MERFGNYEIEGLLGQGGVATVWRAHHRYLGTSHALKVLSRPSKSALARLLREGRVQAQLQHPNIVPVTDIVVEGDRVALAMPFISGGTLQDMVRLRETVPPQEALSLFRQILDAVVFANEGGVLHRDLKPQNVLMERGVPRVADFGIARLLDPVHDPELTRTGAPMGTLGFCSPEQWASAAEVDERADVFSLGALLYYMLAGKTPFDESDPTNVLRNTLTGRHPDLRRVSPDCSEDLVVAVHRTLLPKPDSRFPTARAFGEALGLELRRPQGGRIQAARPAGTTASPSEHMPVLTTGADESAGLKPLGWRDSAASVHDAPSPGGLAVAPKASPSPSQPRSVLRAGAQQVAAGADLPPDNPALAALAAAELVDLDEVAEDDPTLRSALTIDEVPVSEPGSVPNPPVSPHVPLSRRDGRDTFLDEARTEAGASVAVPIRKVPMIFALCAAAMVLSAVGLAAMSTLGQSRDATGPVTNPVDALTAEAALINDTTVRLKPTSEVDSEVGDTGQAEPADDGRNDGGRKDGSNDVQRIATTGAAAPSTTTRSRTSAGSRGSATPAPTGDATSAHAESCPSDGTNALGWWNTERKGRVDIGDVVRVRRDAPVTGAGKTVCTLQKGDKVEVVSAPQEQADGSLAVKVFPTAIRGKGR